MPFQISLQSTSRSRGVINSFTAGADQFATCAPEIILTAAVDGNLGGHTIRWEQLSGDTQIVWLTPVNQLEVVFAVVGGGSSDRVFRFYIDKGTPLEQYDDVVTWGTPTETEPLSYSALVNSLVSTDQACRDIPCASVRTYYEFPTPPNDGDSAIDPVGDFFIAWDRPTCSTYYHHATIVFNDGGTPVVLGEVSSNSPQYLQVPDALGTYYVYTTHVIDSVPYTQRSCRISNERTPGLVPAYITDTNDSYIAQTNVSTIYYKLIGIPEVPTSVSTSYRAESGNVSGIYFVLTTIPESIISVASLTMGAINSHTAVYYSNNGIGG